MNVRHQITSNGPLDPSLTKNKNEQDRKEAPKPGGIHIPIMLLSKRTRTRKFVTCCPVSWTGAPNLHPKIGRVCGAHWGTYRKRGGGERSFQISRPVGRLHPRAMNEWSQECPRVGPSAEPRAASLPLQPPARGRTRGAHSSRRCKSKRPPKSPFPRESPEPPAAPFTFQQPLDDAVDVEFIYIRHRLPTADPPAVAPPPARARDLHLLSHATSTEMVVAAVAKAAAGPPQPPRSLLPPSFPTGTTRRTKWPPTP